MLVKLLIGPSAGEIVDLPQHAAEAELQFGTARLINVDDRIPNVRSAVVSEERVDKDSESDKPASDSGRLHNAPKDRGSRSKSR